MHSPQQTLDAVLTDWQTADVPERTRAALALLECMTRRPLELDAGFVQSLRARGLDDAAIDGAGRVSLRYNFINRMADAFDFPIPTDAQRARIAKILNSMGRRARAGDDDTLAWMRDDDGCIRPQALAHGRRHLLSAPGHTSPELRRSIEAFMTGQWGVDRPNAPEIPDELSLFLKKLARAAYKITDADIDGLLAFGYDKDKLFEITAVGAFAIGLLGLERLYLAMYGSD